MNNQELTKTCSKCQDEKPVDEFHKAKREKDGLRNKCKSCRKQHYLEHRKELLLKAKQHYSEHREEAKQYNFEHRDEKKLYNYKHHLEHKEEENLKKRQHYLEHKEEINLKHKQWLSEHKEEQKTSNEKWRSEHREKCKINKRQWDLKHKKERNQYEKNRRETNPIVRLITIVRGRNRSAFKSQGVKKRLHTIESLGCTALEYQNYIQSHLKPGMTMENKGPRKWHLHHIKPVYTFDLRDIEQQKLCFHYTNIIPMWEDEHKLLHIKD